MSSEAGLRTRLLAPYDRTLAGHAPYLVASVELQERLNTTPLGLSIAPEHRFDPTRRASVPFLRRLEQLDRLTYGPLGMATPRWALYDCAALPGIVFGLGRAAAGLSDQVARALHLGESDGPELAPASMFVAVPMLEQEHWLGYALCDVYEAFPGASPPGLRIVTLALAADLLGIRRLSATTQWASTKLRVYARFAPLVLRAAWLPVHSWSATCAFTFEVDEDRLAHALGGVGTQSVGDGRGAVELVDVCDSSRLVALQRDLEAGRRVEIVGPPEERGALLLVPIRRRNGP